MAYNTGFPETYSNGYPQNNYPQYSYNQQYGLNQLYPTYPASQNLAAPMYASVSNTQNHQSQQAQQQSGSTGIIWVQGEAGAKAYPLAPNNKVLLMDSENPVLYVKSVNASGVPDPLQIYDLVQRDETVKQAQTTVEEDPRFKTIEDRLSKIESKIQSNTGNNKQRGNRSNG